MRTVDVESTDHCLVWTESQQTKGVKNRFSREIVHMMENRLTRSQRETTRVPRDDQKCGTFFRAVGKHRLQQRTTDNEIAQETGL